MRPDHTPKCAPSKWWPVTSSTRIDMTNNNNNVTVEGTSAVFTGSALNTLHRQTRPLHISPKPVGLYHLHFLWPHRRAVEAPPTPYHQLQIIQVSPRVCGVLIWQQSCPRTEQRGWSRPCTHLFCCRIAVSLIAQTTQDPMGPLMIYNISTDLTF